MGENETYYRVHVFCCTNVRPKNHPRGSCGRCASAKLRDHMKSKAKQIGIEGIRINASGCLDRCELGPVMVIYPEGTWYHYTNEADIDEILDSHIIGGEPVKRLKLSGGTTTVNPKQS